MLNISEDRITRKETLNIYILFLNFSCKKNYVFQNNGLPFKRANV